VLEYGDGWFPNMRDLDELAQRIAELQRRAADAGRERIPVTYFGLRDADDDNLERMAAAGVDRVLLMLPPKGRDESLAGVERYAELAARHR
jgi:alkanesulfonate monooxygenase SsuD/methylene tetrahydromethanopterin reductase-like flavin-dependent oxidoreductase (luciferase family)